MISKEDFVKITAMQAAGMYQKDIASELGIAPKTLESLNWNLRLGTYYRHSHVCNIPLNKWRPIV